MAFSRALLSLSILVGAPCVLAQDSSQFGVPLWLGEQGGADDRRLHMELDGEYENVKFCPASFVTNTAPFVTTNFCTTTTTTTITQTSTTTTRTSTTSTLTTTTKTSSTSSATTTTLTTTTKTTSTSTTSTRTTSTSTTSTVTSSTKSTTTTLTTTQTTTTTSSTTATTSTSTQTTTTTTTSTSTLTTSTSTQSTTTTLQTNTVTTSTSTITTTTTLTTTTTTSSTRTTSTSSTTTTTTVTGTTTTRTTTTTTRTTTTATTSTSTFTTTTTTSYTNTTTTSTGTTTTMTTTTTSSTTTTTTTTPYFCPLCKLYPTQNCHQIAAGQTCTAIPMETECVEQTGDFAQLQCSAGGDLQRPPTRTSGNYPQVVCKVCGTPAITADTDKQALSYTGTLTFGPNMKANFVNESLVKSYVLQWTFGNGRSAAFGNISEIPKSNASDPINGCCNDKQYTFELNKVPIKGTHIMISPIAYGVPGGNVAEFLMPDGVEVSVVDVATECPPLISYLRPIDEDLVMQACTTIVNTTTSTVTTRTATTTTASSTTTSTATGTKTTSTSSTTTATTTTRTTSTSTTTTTITATTDTTTLTTDTTTATTATTTTTSTTKTSTTSTVTTKTQTTTTKTTSTSSTSTSSSVTTTTRTSSTSTTSTVTTTTTTTITTTTTTTSSTTATTSTSTQTTSTSTVSTSTVTTSTTTTLTTSTSTVTTKTQTTTTATTSTTSTSTTTTVTTTTKTITSTTMTTTSTTVTKTTTTKTTTVVPCGTCNISLWEGCTDNEINPSQTCEQVTSWTTSNMSDPYWKDKFRVVQSDCVAYEGELDQYCPAGNDQMLRAPEWRTYNTAPNYNGYYQGHPGYPSYSHTGARQDEPWYSLQQALPQVVCQVCALVGAEDTDQAEGSVTMTVHWGQNAVGDEIDQQPVGSYQLYWTNDALELTDASPIITVEKPNPEQFDQKTHCGCNEREYVANLEMVNFPAGTTKLMVVPVDVNGFAMPVGKAFDVVDQYTTTTTTATMVTVTQNRPGGIDDGSGTTPELPPGVTLPKNAQAGAEQTRLSTVLLFFTAMAFLLAC